LWLSLKKEKNYQEKNNKEEDQKESQEKKEIKIVSQKSLILSFPQRWEQ